MNPYIELGITPAATFVELKKAYRRAVLQYHPDSAAGHGDPEKFNSVIQAYRVLKNKYEKKTFSGPQARFSNRKPQSSSTSGHGITVDATTAQMPLHVLIHNLENSDNRFVQMIAIKAIALKRSTEATHYLVRLLNQLDTQTQCYVIQTIEQLKLYQACPLLLSWVLSKDPDVSLQTIKSLEAMSPTNRRQIIQKLKSTHEKYWEAFVSPFQDAFRRINSRQKKVLGDILLNESRISKEQLEIALLLQKRHALLLGEILQKLNYISITEVQKALLTQKHSVK
ncbi:MAG: DnaJ domain-containing protein [SAR324 cluster bacterium]|nr:DnaJ domain-containing protein [SAR324 cluster bacterium]